MCNCVQKCKFLLYKISLRLTINSNRSFKDAVFKSHATSLSCFHVIPSESFAHLYIRLKRGPILSPQAEGDLLFIVGLIPYLGPSRPPLPSLVLLLRPQQPAAMLMLL